MNKLTVLLAALMLAGTLVSNAADDTAPKKDAKAKRAEQLKKYDKNGDGKLDDEEKKAMRDDQKKQRENGGGGKKEKSN